MKKTLIILGISILVGALGAPLMAYDTGNLGNDMKGMAKGAAQGATADQINGKLAKQNCSYASKTSIEPTCNVDKIVSLLSGFGSTAKSSGFAKDVEVVVSAYGKDSKIAKSRAEYLRDKVKQQIDYWNYRIYYQKGDEEADFKVEIR